MMFSQENYALPLNKGSTSTTLLTGALILVGATIITIRFLKPLIRAKMDGLLSMVTHVSLKSKGIVPNDTSRLANERPVSESTNRIIQATSSPLSMTKTPAGLTILVTVRATMLNDLTMLGITALEGDKLALEALKSAYKKACLTTHPDKTQQSDTRAFIAIQVAYEHLLTLIKQSDYSEPTMERQLSEMADRMALMKEQRECVDKEIADMEEEAAHMNNTFETVEYNRQQFFKTLSQQDVRVKDLFGRLNQFG